MDTINSQELEYEDIERILDYIKPSFWRQHDSKGGSKELCFFCEKAKCSTKNEALDAAACAECVTRLKQHEKECTINFIFRPSDPVGQKLRALLCDWCHKHYHGSITIKDDYPGNKKCCICHQPMILNANINSPQIYYLAADTMAHVDCCSDSQLAPFFTEKKYNDIITECFSDCLVGKLFTDFAILDRILESEEFPRHVDFSEIRGYFASLTTEYWSASYAADNSSVCEFCQNKSSYNNDYIKVCASCHSDIISFKYNVKDPQNHPVSLGFRRKIKEWINYNYYCVIEMDQYIDEFGATNKTCDICQKSITDTRTSRLSQICLPYRVCQT